MLAKFKQMPLERQLFISFVSVSSILLLVTMGIMLYVDITRQLRSMDDTIRSSAAYIAQLETVEDMLERGYPDPAVSRQLDSLSENVKDLNVIVIYNTSGLRFYHTDRQQSGETFVEGEEVPILEGSEPYITTGYSTYGSQRRAFHAVENDQGEIIGFVMTSIFTSDIWEQNRVIVIYALVILGVVLLLGVGLSRGIVALLRGSLKGHHPTELLELYLSRKMCSTPLRMDWWPPTGRERSSFPIRLPSAFWALPRGNWRGGSWRRFSRRVLVSRRPAPDRRSTIVPA